MPVFIEYPTEFSQQDLTDLDKIYADMPAELLAPYADAATLIQQGIADKTIVVARFNSRLLGAALLNRQSKPWLLSHLCIREITRQRGVAKRLVSEVYRVAQQEQSSLALCIPQQLDSLQQWAKGNNYPTQLSN